MGPYPGLDIGGYFSDKVQQISEGIFKGYFSDLLYFHIFHIRDWILEGIFQVKYNSFAPQILQSYKYVEDIQSEFSINCSQNK